VDEAAVGVALGRRERRAGREPVAESVVKMVGDMADQQLLGSGAEGVPLAKSRGKSLGLISDTHLHITTSTVPNIDCHVKKQLSCHIAAMSIAVGAALVRPRQCWLQFRRRQRHRQW